MALIQVSEILQYTQIHVFFYIYIYSKNQPTERKYTSTMENLGMLTKELVNAQRNMFLELQTRQECVFLHNLHLARKKHKHVTPHSHTPVLSNMACWQITLTHL